MRCQIVQKRYNKLVRKLCGFLDFAHIMGDRNAYIANNILGKWTYTYKRQYAQTSKNQNFYNILKIIKINFKIRIKIVALIPTQKMLITNIYKKYLYFFLLSEWNI